MGKRSAKRKGSNRKIDAQRSKGNVFTRLDTLREQISLNPDNGGAWKELAKICLEHNELEAALTPARRAAALMTDDSEVLSMQAAAEYNEGNVEVAIELFQQVIELTPNTAQPYHDLATVFHRRGEHNRALELVEKGLRLDAENMRLLDIKGAALRALNRYDESYSVYKRLIAAHPDTFSLWIDLGNLNHDLGDIEAALRCYAKAKTLSGKDATAYSNQLTTLHYHPDKSRDEILQTCLEWQERYAPAEAPSANHITDLSPSRPLRIGMISDGFRKNPVGLMITSALENLTKGHYEFYAYTTNNVIDEVTRRLQKVCSRWIPITQAHGQRLRDQIAEDEIDILIDLAGHHKGSRMTALAMKPAPLIVKWVGGLINTTGVKAIDYLISDTIETPEGVDDYYTEKLIRLPNDYICYDPPSYAPDIDELPAQKNGFITFGCFNNPLKINPVLAREWAELLKQHPGSKLVLKSFQYNSAALCDKIAEWMLDNGIERTRLIFEGASPHSELLKAYNQIDIALDPWPYSGGLTTCEALLMGVPVVTLPGPTFAGRHSASHLVNAGLPELVTNTWDEYRTRVQDLVSDLESLSTIRSHLRTVLLHSPVCDPQRFAHHLDSALRAIWQRHTEHKAPAALRFNENDQVLFEGEDVPVELQHPPALVNTEEMEFHWEFESKVIAIDHGAQLLDSTVIKKMLEQGAIELFSFDPASNHLKTPLIRARGVHYYPNTALGNGKTKTLYACQSPTLSGTLEPLQEGHLPPELKQELTPLAEVPINSLALDTVNDLPSIDWLILDSLNNSADLLENGTSALKETLLIHANIAFQPTHKCQPSFAAISLWAERNGFRFYCFCNEEHRTQVPQTVTGKTHYSNELTSASALFIPSYERLKALSTSQRRKLAFIAETVYSLEGLCFEVLEHNSDEEAGRFIQYKTNKKAAQQPSFAPKPSMHTPPESEVAEAPSHQQNLQVTDVVTDTKSISKPELTLPNEVARHLKEVYTNASVILEYGSGGSTVLASELSGKQVFTVENDLSWAANMISYINQASLPSPAVIHTVDIGKTGPWARPLDDTNWRSFHKYPLSVWDREDFVQPDVILIDGRFRVACFVAAVMKISKPTIVLFDDYGDRDFYHDVERLAKPVKMIGRMAHFELKPGDIPVDELTWMIASFTKVTYANHTRP